MTNKQLHDFLLKEVEGFVLEATSQIAGSGKCIPADVLLDGINEAQNGSGDSPISFRRFGITEIRNYGITEIRSSTLVAFEERNSEN